VRAATTFTLAFFTTLAFAMDIDTLWEYGDPAASEARFRSALEGAKGDERLELLTQIARTHSLRGDYASAHRVLDEIEPQLEHAGALPKVRALLERGRTYNSAGEAARARPLFEAAFGQAEAAHLEGLAVDAAHMVAITHGGSDEAVRWNRRGLALARASQDAKAQGLVPAMLNNMAWDLHDMGRAAEALPVFEEALVEWRARKRLPQTRIAQWSVARCLRSLGRHEDALALLRPLEAERAAAAAPSGYVFEEMAENLAALGRDEEARPWFARAADELARDEQVVKTEPARLARLRERAGKASAN
jgi:tetratricopeptide (TPR) repeat protein